MPQSCFVKTCRNKAKSGASLSFHRLPVREPERLKLWLSALNVDTNTPQDELKKCTVCSEHFAPQDYTANGQVRMHRFLTPTAVPTVGVSFQRTGGSGNIRTKPVELDFNSAEDTRPVSEELPPSLQQCDTKVEQVPVLEETQIHPQVKEEKVDQYISPEMEAHISNNADVKSEPTSNSELFPFSNADTETVKESVGRKWKESGGSSSAHRGNSIEVFVETEHPQKEAKSCHMCAKTFKKDSYLIRHVSKSHKGHKAFKCLECDKEFDQRYQLVLHIRSHTGEKPFSCDYCGKTFVQNSSRLAHMRVHTGEKPYFCAKCGKSFATSNHFKFCKMLNKSRISQEKGNADENRKEEKAFKCFECNKEFDKNHQLVRHSRVHTGEKPFSCDFCGKTFTQNSNRTVHMRQHTGEKPYSCNKCGKRFASSHHLKLCTGTQRKSCNTSFRCTTCGRNFHSDSNLKVHMEVHESWQRYISEKLQEQGLEENKLKAV